MNTVCTLYGLVIAAKTCGCKKSGRDGEDVVQKITYAFLEKFHSLCIGKKEILQAQIQACEMLLQYGGGGAAVASASEKAAIKKEVQQLRMALDLLS